MLTFIYKPKILRADSDSVWLRYCCGGKRPGWRDPDNPPIGSVSRSSVTRRSSIPGGEMSQLRDMYYAAGGIEFEGKDFSTNRKLLDGLYEYLH